MVGAEMATEMTEAEMLARMWIECDPNRMPLDPDEPIDIEGGTMNGLPNWHWFMPRAQASIAFFEKHGYKLVKIDGE